MEKWPKARVQLDEWAAGWEVDDKAATPQSGSWRHEMNMSQ